MVFAMPLFAFGLFITLLVGIGVVLAVVEFRTAHAPQSLTERKAKPLSHPEHESWCA